MNGGRDSWDRFAHAQWKSSENDGLELPSRRITSVKYQFYLLTNEQLKHVSKFRHLIYKTKTDILNTARGIVHRVRKKRPLNMYK